MRTGNEGFALIAVLWLVAIFSIVALGYSRTTRFKSQELHNELILAQEEQLFASGLEMASFQYQLYRKNKVRFLFSGLDDTLTPGQRSVMWYPRYETYPLVMEEHVLHVRIEPLGARMAFESMTGERWYEVLGACGVSDEGERLAIISALADWQDGDSLLHPDGAEQDYYDTLATPYVCKNAPIQNLDELRFVRGISADVFLGSEGRPGLRHFLTMEGSGTMLDINCASSLTFQIVPGITQEEIDAIVAMRQEKPIVNLAEVQEMLSLETAGELGRFFHIVSDPESVRIVVSWDPDPGPGVRCATRMYSSDEL